MSENWIYSSGFNRTFVFNKEVKNYHKILIYKYFSVIPVYLQCIYCTLSFDMSHAKIFECQVHSPMSSEIIKEKVSYETIEPSLQIF